jgi:uncharacterized YceG family protein
MAGGSGWDRPDTRRTGGHDRYSDDYPDDSGQWPSGDDPDGGRPGAGRHSTPNGYHDRGGYPGETEYGDAGYDQSGYDQSRYGQAGYDQAGYDQAGYDQGGYNQAGYDQGGYNQGGYDQAGYDQGGYDQAGFDQGGYDRAGFDQGGYDRAGHDRAGHDRAGYPRGGYEQGGRDQSGYGPGAADPYGDGRYGRERYPDGDPGAPDQSGAQGWSDIGRHDSGPHRRDGYPAGGQSYDPADTGSHRWADTGSFDPADSGSYDMADSAAFDRPGPGSYDPADSAAFDRPDTGSHARPGDDDRYDDRDSRAPASMFQPLPEPSASSRHGGRNSDDRKVRGRGRHGEPDVFASWPDDPDREQAWDVDDPEADWNSDDDSGLLSRFGRDGGNGGGKGRGKSRKGRGGRPRKGRGRAASLISVILVLAVLGGAGGAGYYYVHSWIVHRYGDYTGSGSGTVNVTVPNGASLEQLGPALLKAHVIEALRPYDQAAGTAKNASSLQPGTYKLHLHMSAALAVQALLSGKTRLANTFTVLPDSRAKDIAANLAKRTGIPVSQFLAIINHPPASLGIPSWAAGKNAEGFLFPDTYTLAPHETAVQILQAMVADFNRHVGPLNLPAAAKKVFTTPYHVLIVASLVQAEAGSIQDFGKISRVAWHRLALGWKLQFDSSVLYGLGKYGTHADSAELADNTPYNTYMHAGLPPGPIGSPQLLAIQAALHPTPGPWLYFIANKAGQTYFTNSIVQFHKWQREFGT